MLLEPTLDKLNAMKPYRVGDEKTQPETDPAEDKPPMIVGHYTAYDLEAVGRLVPGVMGNEVSAEDESFADGLLEYPHYTRPADFRGWR